MLGFYPVVFFQNEDKMDAPKSSTLNNTLRLVFSLAHAVLLVFCVILLYVIQGELQLPSIGFLLMVLPAISFGVGILMNSLI